MIWSIWFAIDSIFLVAVECETFATSVLSPLPRVKILPASQNEDVHVVGMTHRARVVTKGPDCSERNLLFIIYKPPARS